jgi:hypothetical protein
MNVIAAEGFEDFQPVACFPARHDVRALAGLPSGEDPEIPTLEWASRIAEPAEEFVVAFKCDATHFKAIRQLGSSRESKVFGVPDTALSASP